jgi:Flp pilus assembly protein TadG
MGAFMGVGIVAFVGFAGLSVDAMRGYLVQSRLSSALDAAGLAGARVMYSPTRNDDIRMFFESNFPPGYMGAAVIFPDSADPAILEPQVDAEQEVLTLRAQATIQTTLMRVLGFDTLTVGATTQITRETEMLDVVLAVDMSGSMGSSLGSGTRISAARDAATELINILFGTDELKSLLKIGLVPWSSKVNVSLRGSNYDPSLTTSETVPNYNNPFAPDTTKIYHVNNSPVPLLSNPPAGWRGCVFARYRNGGVADDADLMQGPALASSGTPLTGLDWPAWQPTDPTGEPVSGWQVCSTSVNGGECTSCLPSSNGGITPLQSTKTGIQTAIDALTSPSGNTNAVAGLAWAWRVLTPEPPFTDAELNPLGNRTQAIILLTDGDQTGNNGDAYKAVFGVSGSVPGQDQRLRDLADTIKAQGVLIYTIQFANTSGPLATLMKYVATGPDKPFYQAAPTAEELRTVFQEVANDLSQLRVSM